MRSRRYAGMERGITFSKLNNMKKIIAIFLSALTINAYAQRLDTARVTITLRAYDWGWGIGKYGAGEDSMMKSEVRKIRDSIRLANPQNRGTNVTIRNVSGRVAVALFSLYLSAPTGETGKFFGNTAAERATIYTNIKAISNSAVQYWVGYLEGVYANTPDESFNRGKNYILDN